MEENKPDESWWETQIGKVKAFIAKAESDRLLKELTPQEKLDELWDQVQKGNRTRKFLQSEFWKNDLEPMLREETKLKPWSPGDPLPFEEVASLHLYNSGKVWAYSRLLARFQEWITKGEKAQKELEREAEKKRRISLDRSGLSV